MSTEITELDLIDRELISLLERNARISAADLAKEVGLSPTAVTRRVHRLELSGVITGYSAQVDYARLGYAIEALIEVRFIGKTRPQAMDDAAVRLPEVVAVFTTSGNYDALVWVRAESVDHLRDVIDALRGNQDITDTRTHIVLAAHLVHGQGPRGRSSFSPSR